MAKISIIGAGTWAIGLSIVLSGNGHEVTMWSALEKEITMLRENREHKSLPGVLLPADLILTENLKDAVESADALVLAVASVYVRETARKMAPWVRENQIVINVAKGLEEGTLDTLSDIIEEEIPGCQVCVLSGPSHAEEVSRGIPTTCVSGARKKAVAEYVQNLFMSPKFRVYTSPDVRGIELGGALKNVIALAAGTADGLGYGDNTKAALITRGLAELTRLGIAAGANAQTLYGLTGIGDLIVTCASMHSRNRRAGILIGKGCSMEEAMKEVGMVVEGVYSARAALAMAKKYQVEMPIVEQVNQVLFEGKPAALAVSDLMLRDKKIEHSDLPFEE